VPELNSFEYALVRVVPYPEREEFLNAGAILYCRAQRFLEARIALDRERLVALAPGLDLEMVEAQLALISRICTGGAAAGPIAQLSQADRFRWLTSPRSSTIQISPVHCGLCDDPRSALGRIVGTSLGI
jgi:hypothetical protein